MEDKYMFTATQLGRIIGKSARETNQLLLNRNVLKKVGNFYMLTESGREYGTVYNFVSGGCKTISNIKYNDRILNIVFSLKVLNADEVIDYSINDYEDLPF